MKFLVLLAIVAVSAVVAEKGLKIHNRNVASPRVIGGENAAANDIPHQVSLQWGFFGFYQHVCGASIISENWVVTAAHCKTELPEGEYQIIAGIIQLSDSNVKAVAVSQVIVHPDYEGGVNPNDIALMKLATPLSFDDAVKAANLPAAGVVPVGTALLSGWGSVSTTEDPDMPDDLKKVELSILTWEECAAAVTEIEGTSEPLAETNVCTGSVAQSIGACSGDSGGPLTQGDTLIGIVSWGFFPCGTIGAPSVFTQVSSFIQFINENTGI